MSPELTGFLLGLLLGAAKVMTIGTLGFGIAWWRGRARIRALEAELFELGQSTGGDAERLRLLEARMEVMTRQLDLLADSPRLPPERAPTPLSDRTLHP
jgi:hypothetical protein